jgi:hypothetical protein
LIAAAAAAAFLSCPWFLQLLFCNALLLSFTYCPARGAHFGFFLSLCHFVSDSHEVMTALIVVLPLIVVVEISLQLHR